MPRCLHCRNQLEAGLTVCPHCRAELPNDEAGEWVSVARMTNLAEAGFFADLLADEQIATHVRRHDRFSAVDGSWATDYFLQIHQQDAPRAAALIRQHLEESGGQETPPDDLQPAGLPDAGSAWKPLVAVLVVGGLACLVGQSILDGPERHAPPVRRPTLWSTLGKLDQPLVSQPQDGRPGFRLYHDRHRNLTYLDHDHDGDGKYDQRLTFRDGRLVSESGQPGA